MENPDLSLIVAMTPERIIGRDNALPWHLPSDLTRFKQITTEIGTIVMGRKTYESILAQNGQPLAKRHHIVLSSAGSTLFLYSKVKFVTSQNEALHAILQHHNRACIIGGEQIFKLFFPFVNKAYVTLVHAREPIAGDAYFPETFSESNWRRTSLIRKFHIEDEHTTSFLEFERIK